MQKLAIGVLIFFLVVPAPVSIGDEFAYVSVVNKTDRYLHVIMNEVPYLYIPPDMAATYQSKGSVNVTVQVFYAPGQGISGGATRTITIRPSTPATQGCNYRHGEGCECVTTPPEYGPVIWEVNADTLQTTDFSGREG